MNRLWMLVLLASCWALPKTGFAETPLAELEQQALRAASEAVADSVVQIRTVGGLDRMGRTLLSQGPTTGVIVSEDGYIVSSAFNLAGQPSSIVVRLADGRQQAAELVAHDRNRMLVLLKIATDRPLPVPNFVPAEEFQVGQWAVALGRTFQTDKVDISVGIVSAINRMYGRVLQTDANVSAANYGGPLVDISGRVLGVLVPMSPQSSRSEENAELAGAEFYDSGIGFAVPWQHILSVLKRWKSGDDLLPGRLGVALIDGDPHMTPPELTAVWPSSPAAEASWQAGDVITSVNGQSVETQAHVRFQLYPLYAGDSVDIILQRGDEQVQSSVVLVGELATFRHSFLGVIPTQETAEDAPQGVQVRAVWPDSPAQQVGLQPADLLQQIGESKITSTAEARSALASLQPSESTELQLLRGEEQLTLSATLAELPTSIIPSEVLSGAGPAGIGENSNGTLEPQTLQLPEFSQQATYLLPSSSDERLLGLMIWLGDGNTEHAQQQLTAWQNLCQRDGLVLVIAPPASEGNWTIEDTAYLQKLTAAALQRFPLDQFRTVIGGRGKAGQLAYALAFRRRTTFDGVVAVDAPLPRTLSLPETSPGTQLAVLSVESDSSNFAPLIRRDLESLREAGYPVSRWELPADDGEVSTFDRQTREAISRWINTLDRF